MQKYIDKVIKLHADIAKNVPASREQSSALSCLKEAERHLAKELEASGAVNDRNE